MRQTVYFWEEKLHVQSSTRLLSFFVFVLLARFDLVYLSLPSFKMDYYFLAFNLIFLVAIFTPKYLHKIAELNSNKTQTT